MGDYAYYKHVPIYKADLKAVLIIIIISRDYRIKL